MQVVRVAARLGMRPPWTADQLEAAYDALDEIGDQVAASIQTAIAGGA